MKVLPAVLLPVALLTLPLLAAHAADVQVEITATPQAQGVVFARIYAQQEGFPSGEPLQKRTVPAVGGKAVLEFTGLPAGTYAVAAFLDQNNNAELDRDLVGRPREPYGFSRNARALLGPPSFADAAFTLGSASQRLAFELK